jgi:hypothetical protein
MATDLTGRYPVPSRLGHEYVLVTRYLGYIHLTHMHTGTRSGKVLFFSLLRLTPLNQVIMDNEKSGLIVDFFRDNELKVEFVPPPPHQPG